MIVCEKAGLTYTAVPKNACTSMKCFFYHVNTGQDFAKASPKKKMGYQGIHHVDGYRMGKFQPEAAADNADKEHCCIIRDPVDRFRSAYKNRLFQYNDIRRQPQATAKAKELGLDFEPTLGELIDRLDAYFSASNILRFHLRPAHFYLGKDLSLYQHVFPIERTDDFCDLVRERSGMDVAGVRANESVSSGDPDFRITEKQYDTLLEYVASDYQFLKDHYAPRSYAELPSYMRT